MQTDQENIIKLITQFIQGGDNSDIVMLDRILHKNFTNTQNGFFEQKGVFVLDKKKYLSLISDGVFGGTPRTINIEFIEIAQTIALAKVILKSKRLSFTSFISLIIDADNEWKVIGNLPHITLNT